MTALEVSDPAALGRARDALIDLSARGNEAAQQALTAAQRASADMDRRVARRAGELAAARNTRSEAAALRAFDAAQAARAALRGRIEALRAAVSRFRRTSDDLTGAGARSLTNFVAQLDAATRALAGALGEVAPTVGPVPTAPTTSGGAPTATAPSPAAAEAASPIGTTGLTLVPLDAIAFPADDRDRISRDGFTKLSRADTMLSLDRLESVVLPAVRRGAGAEYFRALDAQRGLTGHPASHQRVYEGFFGSTAIRLGPAGSGGHQINNGHHRVAIAQQIGVRALPARVNQQ